MMNTKLLMSAAIAMAALATPPHAAAALLYDNLQAPLGVYIGGFPYGEIADDVALASGGVFSSARVAYSAVGFNGDETLTLNLYAMDGAPSPGSSGFATPGTLLYSQTIAINGNGNADFTDSTPNVLLPADVGVGLIFAGVDFNPSTSDAGPLLYDPPSVGSGFYDYWLKGFAGDPDWALFDFGNQPAVNFGLRIEALAVPEPGTLTLLGLGLVGLVASRRRKQ